MILEVQIQNFSAVQGMLVKVFIFKKFQGLKYKYFYENWQKASFCNKEQTQKYKFEIWV